MKKKLKIFLLVNLLVFSAAGFSQTPIKIACVGNSITEGNVLFNPSRQVWVTLLQELLGKNFDVANFGLGSRTLLKKGDYPYTQTSQYRAALAFKPNVVIIMLGTNDSKSNNWKYKDEFVSDLLSLIQDFSSLNSNPTIILATPAFVEKDNYGITEAVVGGEIAPMIRHVAANNDFHLIDIHDSMEVHAENNYISDGIHPNTAGNVLLAEFFREGIVNSIGGCKDTAANNYDSTARIACENCCDIPTDIQFQLNLEFKTEWYQEGLKIYFKDGNERIIRLYDPRGVNIYNSGYIRGGSHQILVPLINDIFLLQVIERESTKTQIIMGKEI